MLVAAEGRWMMISKFSNARLVISSEARNLTAIADAGRMREQFNALSGLKPSSRKLVTTEDKRS